MVVWKYEPELNDIYYEFCFREVSILCESNSAETYFLMYHFYWVWINNRRFCFNGSHSCEFQSSDFHKPLLFFFLISPPLLGDANNKSGIPFVPSRILSDWLNKQNDFPKVFIYLMSFLYLFFFVGDQRTEFYFITPKTWAIKS